MLLRPLVALLEAEVRRWDIRQDLGSQASNLRVHILSRNNRCSQKTGIEISDPNSQKATYSEPCRSNLLVTHNMATSTNLSPDFSNEVVFHSYSGGFIVLSYFVSVVGCWTALELLHRRTGTRGLYNWWVFAVEPTTIQSYDTDDCAGTCC